MFFESRIKNEFNINADSFDFTKVSKREKTAKIINYLKKHHDPKLNDRGYSYFFSFYPFSYAMVIFVRNNIFIAYPHQTLRIFVPKYYYDRRTNFKIRRWKTWTWGKIFSGKSNTSFIWECSKQ